MRKILVLVLILGLWEMSFGIGATDIALKKIGYIKNETYLNEYFNISIKLATDGVIQDEETKKMVMDMGESVIGENNENLKALLAASKQKSFNLLYISKYELGAAVDFNPSLICIAEDVSAFKGIKTGEDYIFNTRKILNAANMGYVIEDKISSKNINGINLSLMKASINTGINTVTQDYYSIIINRYAVSVVLSYTNEEEKLYLEKMLNSLKKIK